MHKIIEAYEQAHKAFRSELTCYETQCERYQEKVDTAARDLEDAHNDLGSAVEALREAGNAVLEALPDLDEEPELAACLATHYPTPDLDMVLQKIVDFDIPDVPDIEAVEVETYHTGQISCPTPADVAKVLDALEDAQSELEGKAKAAAEAPGATEVTLSMIFEMLKALELRIRALESGS